MTKDCYSVRELRFTQSLPASAPFLPIFAMAFEPWLLNEGIHRRSLWRPRSCAGWRNAGPGGGGERRIGPDPRRWCEPSGFKNQKRRVQANSPLSLAADVRE